jgi:hypothetical protein
LDDDEADDDVNRVVRLFVVVSPGVRSAVSSSDDEVKALTPS